MRCFIAIDLDEGIKKRLSELMKKINDSALKKVDPNIYHITTHFLGELNEDKVERLKTALGTLKTGSIKLEIRGIGAFPNTHHINTVWVGAYGDLEPLIKQVDDILAKNTDFKRNQKFSAHLTLARVKKKPTTDIKSFIEKNKTLDIGSQIIDEIALKKSMLTPDGPIYEDIIKIKLTNK